VQNPATITAQILFLRPLYLFVWCQVKLSEHFKHMPKGIQCWDIYAGSLQARGHYGNSNYLIFFS